MSIASAAGKQSKKLMKLAFSLFGRGFNSSKCKTWVKMATARIKLLRNKREVVVKQMRRDVALLLQSGQDATARIRVEHVIREQNAMAANEIVELFCDQIVTRLPIIAKQRGCPADLKEGIASLIFAAPRCSDIPELLAIRDIFKKKYGEDFVSAATDLRPDSGVNRLLIEKLSARNPAGELKLKVMKEIAKEYQIEWDTTETEMELLKPPEDRLEGPRTFVSATSLPLNPSTTTRLSGGGEMGSKHFEDAASAAKAAAESAKDAIAAANAAAELARKESHCEPSPGSANRPRAPSIHQGTRNIPVNTLTNHYTPRGLPSKTPYIIDKKQVHRRFDDDESESFGTPCEEVFPASDEDDEKVVDGRHSYNVPSAYSDIHFDESDGDENLEIDLPYDGMQQQPVPTSGVKRGLVPPVHPKLPDYDTLAARFDALKYRKSLG
ncbi:hypothetical protein Nepgr_008433 [Nepenthes gracilis]|uniref:IST1-like protein n=1 Tax=Nepenthes gracilis TaxID=150966 RepID=A0AAD3S8X5_NEPGR|nr:hypothetical protein Nepgr_008433 [Nepenthes gracilis]